MNTKVHYAQKNIFFILGVIFFACGAQALDKEKIEQGREEAKRMDRIREALFNAGKRYTELHHRKSFS